MHYGQNAWNDAAFQSQAMLNDASPNEISQRRPTDPLTDRIHKSIAELTSIMSEAASDLNALDARVFGLCPEDPKGKSGPENPPCGAEEAIFRALAYAEAAAYRVRELAAKLNGRI